MSLQTKHIAVAGIGYVGLSNAILLAQHNRIVGDILLPTRRQPAHFRAG